MWYGILRSMTFASASRRPHVDGHDDGDKRKFLGCVHRYIGIAPSGLVSLARIRLPGKAALTPSRTASTQWHDLSDAGMCSCTNDAHSPAVKDSCGVEG